MSSFIFSVGIKVAVGFKMWLFKRAAQHNRFSDDDDDKQTLISRSFGDQHSSPAVCCPPP